ncbi:MAG: ROK family protein [Chloroflexi bacterium]|nr:ROK family protein [Chloroflexota bacterium]
MASMEDLCISIDIGGTKMRVAVIDRSGTLLQRDEEPTLAHQGREQTVERLTRIIAKLISLTGNGKLVAIGASLAGPVDPDAGTMNSPPNLPGWDGFSLKPLLEQTFNLPMWAANDATLGAIGEHSYGIGQGVTNMLYLTVSTGIGGGIIVDNSPMLGVRGFAGELGHMSIDRNGPICTCGNVGCLETFASGTAVAKFARERLEGGQDSLIRKVVDGDLAMVNSKMVMDAAGQGDPLAVELVEQFASNLGLGLVNLMHIFDPQMIILGGGVSQSYQVYSAALDVAIRRHVMAHLRERINVVVSTLGDDASLLGAAHLAFQRGGRGV